MKRTVWCAVWVMILSCGGGGYQAQRSIAGKRWFEVRSPHFIIQTDIDADATDRRVAELESKVSALEVVYENLLGKFEAPRDVTRVVIFSNCGDVESLHANAVGFVTSTRDFQAQRLMVTCESYRYSTQVLMHELVHVFNHHAFGPLPVWLEEGLAGYLMTVDVENGQVVMGRPFIDTLALHGHPVTNMPTLEKVLTADWQHFHFGSEEQVYYLAAKNLVGTLNTHTDELHARFIGYLRLLASATDRDDAWHQTFGDVNQEELGESMRLYHTESGVHVTRFPGGSGSGMTVRGTPMRKGDVHALWVQVQLTRGRSDDPKPLLDQIDAAVAEDPEWPDADFWRAVVYRYQAKPDLPKVESLLRPFVALHPDDERAYLGLVSAQLSQVTGSTTFSGREKVNPALEAVQPDVLALGKIAKSSTALNEVAWYFALRRMPDVGLAFARRSEAADATCSACKDTLALLLAENGRYDEAYQSEEAAAGMAGDQAVSSDVKDRLNRFRVMRDKCHDAPKTPGCARK